MPKINNQRQTISKSVRFEVFKRDQFKCQYCGSSAPEVLLQIDHMNPVANGGTNDVINLITACLACNSGKSDKLLSDDTTVSKQKHQLEQLQERREQLEMMMQWHEGLKSLQEDIHTKLKEYWESIAKGYLINENGMVRIKKWAKTYPFDEILKAMDIAAEQYLVFDDAVVTGDSWEVAFNKIPGILKVNKDTKENPDLKDFLYIRGIIRNRFNYYDAKLTLEWLEAARSWGATIDELKKIACKTENWTTFSKDIDDLIERYKIEDAESATVDDLPF